MSDRPYGSLAEAFGATWEREGIRGFYRGLLANFLRVLPHNGTRFVVYEATKEALGVTKKKTDT